MPICVWVDRMGILLLMLISVCCWNYLSGEIGASEMAPTMTAHVTQANGYIKVSERADVGTIVELFEVYDPDLFPGGEVNCSLDPGSSQVFALKPVNQSFYQMVVEQPLDRESQSYYRPRLTCQDHGQPPLNTTIDIYVGVEDVNDNAPVFSRDVYEMQVSEDRRWGMVGYVHAMDADDGSNGQFLYSLAEGGEDVGVTVNRFTGEILLKGPMDRELRQHVQFVVMATDMGQPALTSTASVSLTVLDVNDNAPNFTRTVYQMEVRENMAAGTLVGEVQAVDADSGQNGEVEYYLLSGGEDTGVSFDSSTGQIHTTRLFDRELVQHVQFIVMATDRGQPELTSTVSVNLTVLDVNDNFPIFTRAVYQMEVRENMAAGTLVGEVQAVDADSGQNGEVEYHLSPGGEDTGVTIDNRTGKIYTTRPFDRELAQHVQFIVMATDRGQPELTSTASVNLTVLDVNDNFPIFTRAVYEMEVRENMAAGTLVGEVQAVDADSRQNGEVEYHLSPCGEYTGVTIDPSTGQIYTTRSMDREPAQHVQLAVKATDGGHPVRTSSTTVTLKVKDNATQPANLTSEVKDVECAVVGSDVHTLSFTDVFSALNATVKCNLVAVDPSPGRKPPFLLSANCVLSVPTPLNTNTTP